MNPGYNDKTYEFDDPYSYKHVERSKFVPNSFKKEDEYYKEQDQAREVRKQRIEEHWTETTGFDSRKNNWVEKYVDNTQDYRKTATFQQKLRSPKSSRSRSSREKHNDKQHDRNRWGHLAGKIIDPKPDYSKHSKIFDMAKPKVWMPSEGDWQCPRK